MAAYCLPGADLSLAEAAVSHSAELVRGDLVGMGEGPLIRPFGTPSPQGEKGLAVLSFTAGASVRPD